MMKPLLRDSNYLGDWLRPVNTIVDGLTCSLSYQAPVNYVNSPWGRINTGNPWNLYLRFWNMRTWIRGMKDVT